MRSIETIHKREAIRKKKHNFVRKKSAEVSNEGSLGEEQENATCWERMEFEEAFLVNLLFLSNPRGATFIFGDLVFLNDIPVNGRFHSVFLSFITNEPWMKRWLVLVGSLSCLLIVSWSVITILLRPGVVLSLCSVLTVPITSKLSDVYANDQDILLRCV